MTVVWPPMSQLFKDPSIAWLIDGLDSVSQSTIIILRKTCYRWVVTG